MALRFAKIAMGLALAMQFAGAASAQSLECGEPPLLADETFRGQIDGRVQALSRFLGRGELRGEIQSERRQVITQYPEAERTRANAYMEYQVCVMLQRDRSMSTADKIRILIEIRREFQRPITQNYRVIVRADRAWIDNRRLGRVDGDSSEIRLKIAGNRIFNAVLDNVTPTASIMLQEGEHEFEFEALLEVNGGALGVRDRCLGTIRVTNSMTVRPFVSFRRVSFDTGAFDRCELQPIN